MKARALSLFLAFGFLTGLAHAAETETYVNPRFGFSLTYPSYLESDPPPQNGDGLRFVSPDGELSILAFGHFLMEESVDSMWQDMLADYGDSVTYKVKKADWFVISGVRDGTEFYRKVFVQEGNVCQFLIEYPHARNHLYDPVVEQVAKDFVPFLDGDYDRAPAL